jgi:ribonuclease HII
MENNIADSKKLSKKVSFSLSKPLSIKEIAITQTDNEEELRMIRVLIDNLEEKMIEVSNSMEDLKKYIYRFHNIPDNPSCKSSIYSTPLSSPRYYD